MSCGNEEIKRVEIVILCDFHCLKPFYDSQAKQIIMYYFLLISKVKVKNYLFMKYNKNIQNKVFQEKIFKNL